MELNKFILGIELPLLSIQLKEFILDLQLSLLDIALQPTSTACGQHQLNATRYQKLTPCPFVYLAENRQAKTWIGAWLTLHSMSMLEVPKR